MKLPQALQAVSQQLKITCPYWRKGKKPSYLFETKDGYLAWYSGDLGRVEPVGGSYLCLWIMQNADDWEYYRE